MWNHADLTDEALRTLLKSGAITVGGNRDAQIYGTLACKQGKRLRRDQRVFFVDATEAHAHGYRPCYSCMRAAYCRWEAERQPTSDDADGSQV